jgi:hypothetical protein
MSDRYLWDRTGPPDPEVERLEKLLAPLAHRPAAAPRLTVVAARPLPWRALAAVAAVLLVAVSLSQFDTALGPLTGWQIARIDGAARIGNREARADMELRAGEIVRTAAESEIVMQDDDLGRVTLGSESVMRAASESRLSLNRGRLHAFIWAPPRRFVVDTPSAVAVDLGCEYTIDVDRNGDGFLRVSLGWVAFQHNGRESFIPAGAQCRTRRRAGPGIPYYEDAPPALASAVASFDRGDTAALDALLAAARPQDGITLWHILTRVPAHDRGVVFDRFAQLVKLPPEVTREKVIARDGPTIDLCWNALNLLNTDWWRGWERDWRR